VRAVAEAPGLDGERACLLAESLRAEWRMFEEVSLVAAPDGTGFEAMIQLNPTLVRAAAEQQGLGLLPSNREVAEARRLRAVAECIERFNARSAGEGPIRSFRIVG
jgi:hypothetical protein